jgi:hypothetical protein
LTLTPQQIGARLRHGTRVLDGDFDAYLAVAHREVSGRYWSPVIVCAHAAAWLRDRGCRSVLDVGSGIGKFCVVTALCAPELRCIGVEHRASLVRAARALAAQFELEDRVVFVHDRFDPASVRELDALYLFNPFGENAYPEEEWLDHEVEISSRRFRADVATTERALDELRVGGLVLTYHGFGGAIPDNFELVRQLPLETDVLRLWRKTEDRPGDFVWIEQGVSVVGLRRLARPVR